MVSQFLLVLSTVILSILALSYPQVRGQETTGPGCLSQNVTFLHFIPCWRDSDDGIHRSAALEKLDSCDLLARAAVDLAIERVNENQKAEIFPGSASQSDLSTPHVRTVPLFPEMNATINLQTITDAFRFVKSDEFYGIIGPSDPGEAAFWAPIFQRSNLMTVSYNITSSEPDKAATFYRTLPSDHATNIGRLSLIARFEWFRIATISSQDRYYAQMGEDFISLYNKKYPGKSLHSTSFVESYVDSALLEVYSRDINIIFGFFDSETARKVLCQAKLSFTNLVSIGHAWILPAYYNPNWWKLSPGMESECSDEEMWTILESVIFVNAVKYPPMNLSLDEFHSQLLSKAVDLFPSLTEEDLKPYLLRSRATSAHDAVTLLAQSVGVAFRQAGGSKCNNISRIQTAFENIFMECEYCRLSSGCFLNETETKKCQELCGSEYTPNATHYLYHDSGLRSEHLLNYYGQISFSQFIHREECTVGLLWPGVSGPAAIGDRAMRGHIYTIEENFEQSSSCTLQLNLSRTLRNFITNNTHCPLAFQWKGSPDPPRSRHQLVYATPLSQMVIIGVLTGIGFMLAVTFLVFNIVWRKDKAVKATSPWLNIILIVGVLVRLSVPLMDGLIQSAASTKYVEVTHPVCYFRDLNKYMGEVIYISVLVVKNWRLYRIFNNRGMKIIGKGLTDRRLFLGMFLWSVPIGLFLTVRFSITLRLEVLQSLNERLQLEEYGSCLPDTMYIMVASGSKGLLDIYNFVLYCALLGLLFLTSLNHSPIAFHREAVLSFRAVTLALVPVSSLYIVRSLLMIKLKSSMNLKHMVPILWIESLEDICLPMLIMLILFGSSMYVVIKGDLKKNQCQQPSRKLINHYHQLLKQKDYLKLQLSEINQMRLKLLSEWQKQSEASYALTQNIVPGDKYKDQTSGSKSKIDAMHDFMERDNDSLKTSGTVDPFAAVTDGQCPESKSSQPDRNFEI